MGAVVRAPSCEGGRLPLLSAGENRRWSRERCQELTNKSFRSLPSKGRIIVHGILFDDDRTGPFSAAAINVMMAILHNEGREYSGVEIAAMFTEAGFEKVEQIRTVGDWRIVTGVKP